MELTTADYHSNQAVLILYRGGAYGNFIFHVLSNFLDSTVKVNNQDFKFGRGGNSHKTKIYIKTYHLASQIGKIRKYQEYDYKPIIIDPEAKDQISAGSKFLVLCDVGVVDNYKYLLDQWPNALMIRTYMPTFIERLIGYSNLLQKSGHESVIKYKNALFDQTTLEGIKLKSGSFDQNIIDAMITLFDQNFNLYGKTFCQKVDHQRVYNFPIKNLSNWELFYFSLSEIAEFFGSKIINLDSLYQFYHDFLSKQENFKYFTFDKNSTCNEDDLIGQALKQYYQKHNE